MPFYKIVFTLLFLYTTNTIADSSSTVVGQNFSIPTTQQIYFVPLKKINPNEFINLPRLIDLRSSQSEVKSQGQRGACTYFAITSLVESLIKNSIGQELDLSEEYLAWAAKTKTKLRSIEEDSSVAVNAVTIQDFGFMLEKDLPYQQSWFDQGFPCAGKKDQPNIDPICFSHKGPTNDAKIFSNYKFEFKDIESSSLNIAHALADWKAPVTISILAHPKTWKTTTGTGKLVLTETLKTECINKTASCSGHAALIIGYDLEKRIFYFKNSWGKDWGTNGYGTITFDYIDQMSERKLLTGRLISISELIK